jgi:hypothetical protein
MAIRIDPETIYDTSSLCEALEIGPETLARARRDGELRHTRKGRRILYTGRWVLDWITAGVTRQEVARVS